MRKHMGLKILLRAPLKTLLTFLLITSASFALFFRVTDYAVTTRETAKAESFYNGVAALDNTVPDMLQTDDSVDGLSYGIIHEMEDKAWPEQEKLKEFSSLPGVTLADTRYMTAGRIEDYKRVFDKDYSSHEMGSFVLEGIYDGYEEDSAIIDLIFRDVTVHGGDVEIDSENSVKVSTTATEMGYELGYEQYSREFFEKLKKGSRCLVLGNYDQTPGHSLELARSEDEETLCVIDDQPENYLETEKFAFQKGMIEAAKQNDITYDIVYTSDMRAIPCLNERSMVIAEGRPLTAKETNGCVVNEIFLEAYGLSVGDKINIQLGDKLFHQNALGGAKARDAETLSNFVETAELEIIGVSRFIDTADARMKEHKWSYSPSTIFVPSALLPVEVPDDYEASKGEFSVLAADARDIEAFREAVEPMAAEMGLGLRFSDGGWMSIKNSFETGYLTSFLTTLLFAVGVILALLLAVFLYIGHSKQSYAVMRTLGVSDKVPFIVLSVLAVPAGGIAGLFYASHTAAKALENMATIAPDNYEYVLNADLPLSAVIFCLLFELAFISFSTLCFLWKMKKTPLLELLEDKSGNLPNTLGVEKQAGFSKTALWAMAPAGRGTKAFQNKGNLESAPVSFDIQKLTVDYEMVSHGKYSAFRHALAYILRHMKRGMGKTAVSLILSAVLTAAIGMFVLARLTYQDAVREIDVKGKALNFSSSAITELSKSDLIDDFYCYGNFSVHVNNMEFANLMTITNDMERYLEENYSVAYAEGYDISSFEGTGSVCLLGQALAEELDVRPGDKVSLISDSLYSILMDDEEKENMSDAISQKSKMFVVIGIVQSDAASVSTGIIAGINGGAESVYGQPYPFGYCEFTLVDNEKINTVNNLLEEQQKEGQIYAPMASYYVDSAGFENVKRVRDLLESLFPIAVGAAVFIGLFGPGLVVLQSAREASFLRILGVTKKRARCMLVMEQIFLCTAAIVLVAGGLALFNQGLFIRSIEPLVLCWALYFLGCVCGAAAAAIQVTRHKILALLQVKE